MAEVIERSHKETLQFENIRFHKPGMGEIQTESKDDLSTQEGSKAQPKEANAVRSNKNNFRGNRASFQVSGTYAYRGLGNRHRTCFSCGVMDNIQGLAAQTVRSLYRNWAAPENAPANASGPNNLITTHEV